VGIVEREDDVPWSGPDRSVLSGRASEPQLQKRRMLPEVYRRTGTEAGKTRRRSSQIERTRPRQGSDCSHPDAIRARFYVAAGRLGLMAFRRGGFRHELANEPG
jgi:hypothetical protein